MRALLSLWAGVVLAHDSTECTIFAGETIGAGQIATLQHVANAGACCDACTTSAKYCMGWTFHTATKDCFLKDNMKPLSPPRPVDPSNATMSGLRKGRSCNPSATPPELCPEGYPCPQCGASACPCEMPAPPVSPFVCLPPHDKLPFCDRSLSVHDRVLDLVSRINDTDKPNLLTARGGGSPKKMQAIPALGVPSYYWGTNCLHSLNGGSCVTDSTGTVRCPTNFPSGPSFGATFDRRLIKKMAGIIGVELRAMFRLGAEEHKFSSQPSIDCWGPVSDAGRQSPLSH